MAAQTSLRDSPDGINHAAPTAPAGDDPSSLVLYRESLGENGPESERAPRSEYCPKKPLDLVAVERPDLRFPASCDAYLCTICGPRKAQQAAALMTWSARQVPRRRLITLTGLPDDFQTARAQVFDYLRRLRRDGHRIEIAWAIERNPKGTGFHAHGVQHGDYIKQARLQERWGGRIVDIRALATPGAGVYAVKEALRVAGYVTKGATAGDSSAYLEHLERNGGRPVHMSRGFLHGHTKREALAQLRAELADGEALTWVLTAPGAAAPDPAVLSAPRPFKGKF